MTQPVALARTVLGGGSRRALLLHGLTSAGSTWWRTAEALVLLGFTVTAPDLRAHGSSPAGDELSIEAYRDDVLLLGERWDLLIGHSLGGAVAAAALAVEPTYAARVILEDPAVDSEVTGRFLAESPAPIVNPTFASVAREHPDWHRRDVELKVEALRACGPEVSERTMADAAPWDVWPGILGLEVPALIVAADITVGSLMSEDREREAVESSADLRVVRIAGAGHSMHRDSFDDFVALVREFVVV